MPRSIFAPICAAAPSLGIKPAIVSGRDSPRDSTFGTHPPGLSLLLIHHYRKGDGAHWTHKSNGSIGMIGGADVVLGMSRDGQERAKLQGIGRRVREFAWSLRGDGVSWELEGDADEAEKEEGLGEFQSRVLEYLQDHGFAGPTEIARELGSDKGNTSRALAALESRGLAARGSGANSSRWHAP